MRWIVCLGAALAAVGCGRDLQKIADQHVQRHFFDKHEKREAISFLENHGQFFDIDPSTHVDRDVVLPLLKRLKEVAETPQWAIMRPEKKNSAYAMVVGLPKDPQLVDRMAEAVQQADDNYSGFILQQWGHEWLVFDVIDKQAYEFLKKNNPNIDKQRK